MDGVCLSYTKPACVERSDPSEIALGQVAQHRMQRWLDERGDPEQMAAHRDVRPESTGPTIDIVNDEPVDSLQGRYN